MSGVEAVLALLVHAALVLGAAPLLLGAGGMVRARLAGRVGPPLLQPWRDWQRLRRKPVFRAYGGSLPVLLTPTVALAATGAAALLVPSFTTGMATAPVADLLVVAGLLAASRAAWALGAMDAGESFGGLAASRATLAGAMAEPGLLLVIGLVTLLAGSGNLDLAAASLRDGDMLRPAMLLAAGATALLVLADGLRAPASDDGIAPHPLRHFGWGGGGAATLMLQAEAALRCVLWLSLFAALFLPAGLASVDGGLGAWLVGAGVWVLKMAGLFAARIAAAAVLPDGTALPLLGAAAMLASLAALLLATAPVAA